MTVQTAVLIETLTALGADVRWASCNIFSTQDHAAAAVVVGPTGTPEAPAGVPVFAWKGETLEEYWWCTEQALTWPAGEGWPEHDPRRRWRRDACSCTRESSSRRPASLLTRRRPTVKSSRSSCGCSTARWPRRPNKWTRGRVSDIRGVTEETTTGVHRLYQMLERGELLFPAINVNDSVTKSKFDNKYGCRHSLIDGINRATDTLIGGKTAVVFGYGDVGKGSAESLRGQGARVMVTEIDPICALQAAMDGYQVVRLDDVVATADIFITATGNKDVITVADMQRDEAPGDRGQHRPLRQRDRHGRAGRRAGVRRENIKPQVDLWHFADGHAVIVLSEGRLLNLGNATGHPSFVMSNSFANQTIAQIELFTKTADYPVGVYTLAEAPRREGRPAAPRRTRRQADRADRRTGGLPRHPEERPLQARPLPLLSPAGSDEVSGYWVLASSGRPWVCPREPRSPGRMGPAPRHCRGWLLGQVMQPGRHLRRGRRVRRDRAQLHLWRPLVGRTAGSRCRCAGWQGSGRRGKPARLLRRLSSPSVGSGDDSLAEQIQRAFPGTRVVKALNTVTASVMVDPGSLPEPTDLFIAGDDDGAKTGRWSHYSRIWAGSLSVFATSGASPPHGSPRAI